MKDRYSVLHAAYYLFWMLVFSGGVMGWIIRDNLQNAMQVLCAF